MNEKEKPLPDVTIEYIMQQCNWSKEITQQFIDISIERGIIIPLGEGGIESYRVVSKKAIERAKDILNNRRRA